MITKNLKEFAREQKVQIVVVYHAQSSGRVFWEACFDPEETMIASPGDLGFLSSFSGRGMTPELAITAFCENISNQLLVRNFSKLAKGLVNNLELYPIPELFYHNLSPTTDNRLQVRSKYCKPDHMGHNHESVPLGA